jgi:hypothetical protein
MSYRADPLTRPTTAPPNSMATVPIPMSSILALNAELPNNFRTLFPDADIGNVINNTTDCLKGVKIINTAQTKEIESLRKVLADQKEESKSKSSSTIHNSEAVRDNASEDKTTQTFETLNQERTDYQFCVAELVMFITGEGETRGMIDFSKLREVLQKAREGGWNLKMVADAIEVVAPVNKEAAGKSRKMWM